MKVYSIWKKVPEKEQDGRGVGGCGVHLSPQIHQEHTLINRSPCRTPTKSRLEYLTSRKEYTDPGKLSRTKKLGGIRSC